MKSYKYLNYGGIVILSISLLFVIVVLSFIIITKRSTATDIYTFLFIALILGLTIFKQIWFQLKLQNILLKKEPITAPMILGWGLWIFFVVITLTCIYYLYTSINDYFRYRNTNQSAININQMIKSISIASVIYFGILSVLNLMICVKDFFILFQTNYYNKSINQNSVNSIGN